MFPLLARLFRGHPPGFPLRIEARFDQTLVYEGTMRTGADLFGTGGGRPLPPLVYQRFTFERGGRAFSFMVRDDARAMRFAPGERRRAHLDPTGSRVRFGDAECRAFAVEEPDPDEDGTA